MRLIAITALSLSLAAACAPAPVPLDASGAPRACFFVNRVDSFSEGAAGDGTLYVRANARDTFEVQATGVCPDIDWSRSVALQSLSGSTRLCEGERATLLVPSVLSRSVDRCPALVVRRLSEAERDQLTMED